MHTHAHAHTQTRTHTHTETRTHARTHTHTHTHTHTQRHTHTHTRTHARTRAHTHTHTHTQRETHTHTHTHTLTQGVEWQLSSVSLGFYSTIKLPVYQTAKCVCVCVCLCVCVCPHLLHKYYLSIYRLNTCSRHRHTFPVRQMVSDCLQVWRASVCLFSKTGSQGFPALRTSSQRETARRRAHTGKRESMAFTHRCRF